MNLRADEDFPLASVQALREAGFHVVAIVETEPELSDVKVLQQAHESQTVLLTFDRDFGELVFRSKLSPPKGLVYFRIQPSNPGEPAKILLDMIRSGRFSLEGNFTTVKRNLIRQRPLTRS